jgi:hypothetical protein
VLEPGAVRRLEGLIEAMGPNARNHLFTGFRNLHHRAHGEAEIGGEAVLFCRSTSGQHLHAHREYWESILPVPTPYARAPKVEGGIFPGQAGDADWWVSNWAPRSAIKRGAAICVVPGLVSTTGNGRSTWGGPPMASPDGSERSWEA